MDAAQSNLDDHLTAYGLAGLARCWMPARARWSHKYHLDGRADPNESVPHSDVYYSLNVLLGLAKVAADAPRQRQDLPALLGALCSTAATLPVRNGTWGMALWAAAELGIAAPGPVADRVTALAKDTAIMASWQAQDVGLSLSGACAQAAREPAWLPAATAFRDLLMTRFRGPGALFRDGAQGPRRWFGTFATQVYAAMALYQYGALSGDAAALQAADACVVALLALQGRQGEWPWFYSPLTGRVLDTYEVYSVHQHGMAPALLHHAVARGVPGAREAIVRGFGWIFGANELGTSMLLPELSLIYRSQARAGLAGRRQLRPLRALAAVAAPGLAGPAGAGALRLTREMRSYEFGWLLWSFAGRDDYPELTGHAAFRAAAAG